MKFLYFEDLPYADFLALQEELRLSVGGKACSDTIVFAQHPRTITLGSRASTQGLHASPKVLEAAGVSLLATQRGGEATGHEPGQLAIYPIIDLSLRRVWPKQFVGLVETSMTRCLEELFCIKAHSKKEAPGVWVGDRKIASIGLRFQNKVTTFGVAVNITNDLEVFSYIDPCGFNSSVMTSVEKQLGKAVDPDSILSFAHGFYEIFRRELRAMHQ